MGVLIAPRPAVRHYAWFIALRCRFRIRSRNRFRKNGVRTCRSVNTVAVCRCRSV